MQGDRIPVAFQEASDESSGPDVTSGALSVVDGRPDFHAALDRTAYESLRPASAALALLFAILALSHVIILPKTVAVPLATVAGLSACALGGLRYLLGQQQLPFRRVNPIGIGISSLVLLNALLHLVLTFEPRQSTNFALLIIGAGLFFLRRAWFALSVGSALAS
ncbi:MAG TPA: hypothetical protein VI455_20085 [Terriglobia bacterium]